MIMNQAPNPSRFSDSKWGKKFMKYYLIHIAKKHEVTYNVWTQRRHLAWQKQYISPKPEYNLTTFPRKFVFFFLLILHKIQIILMYNLPVQMKRSKRSKNYFCSALPLSCQESMSLRIATDILFRTQYT